MFLQSTPNHNFVIIQFLKNMNCRIKFERGATEVDSLIHFQKGNLKSRCYLITQFTVILFFGYLHHDV